MSAIPTQDEADALERADRLIAEGVTGDRGRIASIIIEAVWHEREACAKWLEANGQPGYAVEIRHRKS